MCPECCVNADCSYASTATAALPCNSVESDQLHSLFHSQRGECWDWQSSHCHLWRPGEASGFFTWLAQGHMASLCQHWGPFPHSPVCSLGSPGFPSVCHNIKNWVQILACGHFKCWQETHGIVVHQVLFQLPMPGLARLGASYEHGSMPSTPQFLSPLPCLAVPPAWAHCPLCRSCAGARHNTSLPAGDKSWSETHNFDQC